MLSSIRGKLLLYITVPLLLVYVIWVAVFSSWLEDRAYRETQSHLRTLASLQANQLDTTLRGAVPAADSLANFLSVNPAPSPAELVWQLRESLKYSRAVTGATVAYAPGMYPGRRLYAPYVAAADNSDPTRTRYMQLDLAQRQDYTTEAPTWWHSADKVVRPYWTRPYLDLTVSGTTRCSYVIPVWKNGTGTGAGSVAQGSARQLLAMVRVDITLPTLNRQFNWARSSEQVFFMIDQSGRFIYHDEPRRILSETLANSTEEEHRGAAQELTRSMLRGVNGSGRLHWNEREQWVSFAPIRSTGWSLGVMLSETEGLAAAHEIRPVFAAGMILSVVLIVITAWVLSAHLLRPLSRLNEAARTVALGRMDVSLETTRKDELGELSRAFEAMAIRLGQREETLLDSRGQRLSSLLEGLGGKFFTYSLSRDGRFVHVSPMVERALGYSPSEFAERFEGLFTENTLNESRVEATSLALGGKVPAPHEAEMMHKDGRPRRLEIFQRPLVAQDGSVMGVDALVCDVTERSQAIEWFRSLIEAAPDAMVLTDANCRIIFVNERAEALFGLQRHDLIGQEASLLCPPPPAELKEQWDWNNLDSFCQEARNAAGEAGWELRGRRNDGHLFPMEVSQRSLVMDDGADRIYSTTIRDVSLQRQAERELRESQLRLDMAMQAGRLSFAVFDYTRKQGSIGGHVARLLGAKEGENFVMTELLSYVYPEDRERIAAYRQRLMETGSPEYHYEYRIVGVEGKVHWLEVKGQFVRNENGEVDQMVGIMLDITERKQFEHELQLANEMLSERTRELDIALGQTSGQLQGILDNSPAPIWVKDANGVYLLANQSYRQAFGVGDQEVVGKTDDAFFSPEVAEGFRANDRRIMSSGVPESMVEAVGGTNDLQYVLSVKFPLYDANGEATACGGVCMDITEQLRLQQELKQLNEELESRIAKRTEDLSQALESLSESEKRFKSIVENMQGGYKLEDLSGRLMFANPGFAQMLGYKNPNDLVGKHMAGEIYQDPGDRERLGEELKEHNEVQGFEVALRHRDGSEVWVQQNVHLVFDAFGQPAGIEGLIINITEQRETRQALEAARQAADESNRAKSDFLANMSHEIRTPMNAILGMAFLAQQTELTETQRNYLKRITAAGNSLLGIINDILDFSKIEAGKLELESTPFEIESILTNLADMFAEKCQDRSVELLFRVDPGVPLSLVGDPLRLGQVLINLVGNAVKFTSSGEIEVALSKVSEDAGHVTLRFAVRDTGIGLSPQEMERLFKPFSQADTTTTRKYGGTGLGLTICRRLVEGMGGSIQVESVQGQGSLFSFTARLAKMQGAQSQVVRDWEDMRGLRVLVVDDNATSRQILCETLQSFHFEATPLESGYEACRLLDSDPNSYQLVLMDWQMPGMDGIEATKVLVEQAQEAGQEPPVVIMVSAYGREELMAQASLAGTAGYLIKPVNPSMLLDTITRALGRKTVSPAVQEIPHLPAETVQVAGARILLVEDNEINQEVALEILKGAAVLVTVANNGQEALFAVEEANRNGHPFHAVLMDCQMPLMDGYEATRRLRAAEAAAVESTGQQSHLPIIAMTANAMAGDRARCLDAGMDDYVSKPIDLKDLFSKLARWVSPKTPRTAPAAAPDAGEEVAAVDLTAGVRPAQSMTSASAKTPAPGPAAAAGGAPAASPVAASAPASSGAGGDDLENLPGIDVRLGLSRLGGNRDLYRRILLKFHKTQTNIVAQIRAGIAQEDLTTAQRDAHTLKGLAGNLGAQSLFGLAETVELAIKGKKLEGAEAGLEELERELQKVLEGIAPLAANAGSGPSAPPVAGAASATGSAGGATNSTSTGNSAAAAAAGASSASDAVPNAPVAVGAASAPGAPANGPVAEELQDRLAELQGLLASDDTRAVRAAAALRAELPVDPHGYLEQVVTAAQSFEFAEGVRLIGLYREWLSTPSGTPVQAEAQPREISQEQRPAQQEEGPEALSEALPEGQPAGGLSEELLGRLAELEGFFASDDTRAMRAATALWAELPADPQGYLEQIVTVAQSFEFAEGARLLRLYREWLNSQG